MKVSRRSGQDQRHCKYGSGHVGAKTDEVSISGAAVGGTCGGLLPSMVRAG
jgi:hypothetical protein